jgi:PAS domain S-box-containing protein
MGGHTSPTPQTAPVGRGDAAAREDALGIGFGRGLGARLVWIVLLASLPLAGVATYAAQRLHQQLTVETRAQLALLAERAAGALARQAGDAEALLTAIARLPEVAGDDPDACVRVLGGIKAGTRRYASLFATDADGLIDCHSAGLSTPVSVADRAYFRQLREAGQGFAAEPIVGRVTAAPLLILAIPLRDGGGRFRGIVGAGLDLDWFGREFTHTRPDLTLAFTLWASDGTVLFRHPDPANWTGRRVADASITRIIAQRTAATQVVEANGLTGDRVLAAISGTSGRLGDQLAVSVTVPVAELYAAVDRLYQVQLGAIGFALLVALFGGGLLAERLVRRRVVALARAAWRLAAGDLTARTGLPDRGDELGRLARAFDGMADTLQRQVDGLHQAEARLSHLNRVLRTLSECNQDLVKAASEARLMEQICANLVEHGGFRAAWIGLVEEDPARSVRPVAQAGWPDGYPEALRVTWEADSDNPTGTAIRTGAPVISNDLARFGPGGEWQATAQEHGFRAVAALPLIRDGQVFGALTVLHDATGIFLEEDQPLLVELAGDVAYGVTSLRARTERDAATAEVRRLNRELEQRVAQRTAALEQANAALAVQEETMRSVVEHLVEGVVTIDERGIIHSCNRAVEQIFGYGRDQLLGQNVALLMDEPERSAHDGYLARYCRTGEARIIGTGREVRGRSRAGDAIELHLSISEFKVRGQHYFTGILRDIREQSRLLRELVQARRQAEAANRAKSDFLSAMSHEIRTPMNGVIGMVDVLAQSSLRGYQVEMVELIRESAYSLLEIIDDILDFSKIEAGRLELERLPMGLETVVERAGALLDRVAEKQGVRLTLFTDPALPAAVWGDPGRLRQVLVNLLGNAIKFSAGREEMGRVALRATPVAESDGRVTVAFTVADNGIGIDPAVQTRLFTPFEQGNLSTTRTHGGTGLGLAICRELVTKMDGEIEVASTPGEGATFTVRVPFERAETPAEEVAVDADVAGLDVLLIGPEPTADFAAYLAHAGARATRVADLGEVGRLEAGQAVTVAVLVVEESEPPLPLLRAACQDRLGTAPILVLVGCGKRRSPRRVGDDLVAIDLDGLTRGRFLQAVALAAGRQSEALYTEPEGRTAADFQPPVRDAAARAGRLILVAEDNAMNQQVILRQLALLGYAADVADDGQAALKRWRQGDYALLLCDLHMPVMDGFELVAAIRAEETADRRRPLLALTANALQGEADCCRAAGFDDYLTKPLPLAELKARLETWLPADASATPAAEEATDGVTTDRTVEVPVDLGALIRLVGDDPAEVRAFLRLYRQSTATVVAELQAAREHGDGRQVGAAAHKLKSSARAIGATALADLCAALEAAGDLDRAERLEALWPRFDAALAAVDAHLASLDLDSDE